VDTAQLQPLRPQQAADRVLDLQHRGHELSAADQQRPHQLRFPALHMHGFEMADAHHRGDTMRIVAIRLVRPRRQKALRVPRLEAEDRISCIPQRAVHPFRQRTGFEPD
jgi:hypothetical protein